MDKKIKKEKSWMLAVPKEEQDLRQFDGMMERLGKAEGIEVRLSSRKQDSLRLAVMVDEQMYQVDVFPTEYELPELFRLQHFFPDLDMEELEKRREGLAVEMYFGDEPLVSYHAQLRILDALLPEKLAVLDYSAEKILSGRWVALEAASRIPPAPRYLFTVQAVSGEGEEVWMHSHGLNRCGLPELEILDSTRDTCNSQYMILETMACRMLEQTEPIGPGEPVFLAQLSQEISLVAAYLPWEEALGYYREDILGGRQDREGGHNENTCAILVYRSQEDYERGRLEPVSIFDELLKDNPIYMISNRETDRMKALAGERLEYMKKAASREDYHILLKLGLEVDPDFRTETNSHEHIWFELLELSESGFLAKLTQEPYYINGLHEGDTGEYPFDCITDWLIFTPSRRISPDDVYLLEL